MATPNDPIMLIMMCVGSLNREVGLLSSEIPGRVGRALQVRGTKVVVPGPTVAPDTLTTYSDRRVFSVTDDEDIAARKTTEITTV